MPPGVPTRCPCRRTRAREVEGALHRLARRLPTGCRTALVVAHPDDETIAAGASLHLLTGLLLVHVTDGAPRGLDDAVRAGFASPEEYGAARQAELAAALALSGCMPERAALDVPDQDASLHMPAIAQALRGLFARHGTQAVITHAYEGGHPDHDAVALAVHLALPGRVLEFPGYHAAPDGSLVTGRFLPPQHPANAAPLAHYCGQRNDAAFPGGQHDPAGSQAAAPGERPAQAEAAAVRVTLDHAEQARKRAMLGCFRTQAQILAAFGTDTEAFRPAHPDFSIPPHPGTLNYEHWGWSMTGTRWRTLAAAALCRTEAPCAA